MASGRGPYLTDVDGTEYVDLVCSWGPMILGHAHPAVLEAVRDAVSRGFSFGTPSENEVLLAEEIVDRVDPVEQVRLVSSGTEATMSAIRLARGFTGRSLVVKFAGHYHGHVDSLLVSAGSGVATLALPDSAGVPKEMAAETLVIPYNDVEALEAVFAARGGEIACLITEAAAGNMGVVPPDPGFTEALRRVTAEHGALLVSDEVMTGFRVARAGWWGHEAVDVAPDLMTFGKVMGGGFPAAAFGGRADVMALLAPDGRSTRPARCPGTLSPPPPVSPPCGPATTPCMSGSVRRRTRSPTRHPPPCRVPVCRTASSGPGRCSPSTSAREPCAPTTTRGTRTPQRSAGSSTRCWMPGSTCRRARSSRGSSPGRTTTPPSSGSSRPCPRPPGPPPERVPGRVPEHPAGFATIGA